MKKLLTLCAAASLLLAGCIKVDGSLGQGLVDKSLLYDTYTVEFPLTDISMKMSSDLSGFSDSKIVIGAIREEVFGLTTRESAFTLIPFADTMDLGTHPEALSFDLYFTADSISCADDSQARIIQNMRITELTEVLDPVNRNTCRAVSHGSELVTDGLPVYNGDGPLQFNFTKAFAQKYVDAVKAVSTSDSIIVNREWEDDDIQAVFDKYVALVPGIHIAMDEPSGIGGRINLFDLSVMSVSSSQYYLNGNVGVLKVRSTWDGVAKDSTFYFVPGEMSFVDEQYYVDENQKFYQYAFNRTTHSTTETAPAANMYVEGGGGLKPVISAKELREKTLQAITAKGGSPENTVITKATIVLPWEMPDDYLDVKYFPSVLSPTIRANVTDSDGNSYYQFAGLTDASVSTEDQGDIDRSNLVYSPDITYHLQEVISRDDLDTATDADIWLLTIHTEKVATSSGTSASDNAYYQQMLYAMYYNSIYGGGYGYSGYGYGSSYNSYSNYYNYALLASMMNSQSQQQYSYNTELDKDRWYCGILNGPLAERAPYFRVTFSVSRD